MLELTAPQWRDLKLAGSEVSLCDPESGQQYVVVKADVYARLRQLLDDSDLSPAEQLHLLARSGQEAGWDDPAMDVYDCYDESRGKLCP